MVEIKPLEKIWPVKPIQPKQNQKEVLNPAKAKGSNASENKQKDSGKGDHSLQIDEFA